MTKFTIHMAFSEGVSPSDHSRMNDPAFQQQVVRLAATLEPPPVDCRFGIMSSRLAI